MAINYKELIGELNSITEQGKETESKKKAATPASKPKVEYKVVGVSNPDIIIQRTSAKKEEQLIILISQAKACINVFLISTSIKSNPFIQTLNKNSI